MMRITEGRIAEEFTYEDIVMVTADFRYPIVDSDNKKANKRINSYYRHIARALLRRAKYELLHDAADEWRFATENSYPFRPFDIVMTYTVANNDDDVLSIYYDVYEYTGGAHGITKRCSDTWRAQSGWFMSLADFYPHGTNIKRLLTDNAVKIAAEQTAAGTHQYFDTYPKLIKKYFCPSKFYIQPTLVSIFYDQYAIAPGFEGTPVFDDKRPILDSAQ